MSKIQLSTDPLNAGNRGKGRPKGSENKINRQIREMVMNALEQAGGIDYMARVADESPSAFLALVGKILPYELKHEGSGLVFKIITGVPSRDEEEAQDE